MVKTCEKNVLDLHRRGCHRVLHVTLAIHANTSKGACCSKGMSGNWNPFGGVDKPVQISLIGCQNDLRTAVQYPTRFTRLQFHRS